MEKKLNYIRVPYGNTTKLAKVFKCTPARVSQALNGNPPHGGLTKKIRHTALTQFEGVELTNVDNQ